MALAAVGVILISLVVGAIVEAAQGEKEGTQVSANASTTSQASTTTMISTTTTMRPTRRSASVIAVVEGDTVSVTIDGHTEVVRIIGMDSPETRIPGIPVQCYGPEATSRAVELLPAGQNVTVEVDTSQEERDGEHRMLAYLWLHDGRLFSEVMLGEGFAHEHAGQPYAHHAAHIAARDAARSAGRGLWNPATCGGDTSGPATTTTTAPPPTTPPATVPPSTSPPPTAARPAPTTTSPSARGSSYANCTEARAAGAAPLYRGEPGYAPKLDRDGDGIACE